ncbi:MAG: methyltransferase domain-containing protein [Planctomycetes bacterium]|nr:methyltransferase domain-containing protein [Planctomycetota bacterium]
MGRTHSFLDVRLGPDQVRAAYSRLAPLYDLWSLFTENRARARSLALAAIRDAESVLEVAVGTGETFARVLAANPAGRVEGIDLTPAMLERARARAARTGHSNHRLAVGDAHRLEFAGGTFDVLLNSYLFDLLPEEDFLPVLAEFFRVLRPGGRLVLTNLAPGRGASYALWSWIYRRAPALLGGCRGVELAPFVGRAGFQNVRRETVTQGTIVSEIVTGHRPRAGGAR